MTIINQHVCLFYVAGILPANKQKEFFYRMSTALGYDETKALSLATIYAHYGVFDGNPITSDEYDSFKKLAPCRNCAALRKKPTYKGIPLLKNACSLCIYSDTYKNGRERDEKMVLKHLMMPDKPYDYLSIFPEKSFTSLKRLGNDYAIGECPIIPFHYYLYLFLEDHRIDILGKEEFFETFLKFIAVKSNTLFDITQYKSYLLIYLDDIYEKIPDKSVSDDVYELSLNKLKDIYSYRPPINIKPVSAGTPNEPARKNRINHKKKQNTISGQQNFELNTSETEVTEQPQTIETITDSNPNDFFIGDIEELIFEQQHQKTDEQVTDQSATIDMQEKCISQDKVTDETEPPNEILDTEISENNCNITEVVESEIEISDNKTNSIYISDNSSDNDDNNTHNRPCSAEKQDFSGVEPSSNTEIVELSSDEPLECAEDNHASDETDSDTSDNCNTYTADSIDYTTACSVPENLISEFEQDNLDISADSISIPCIDIEPPEEVIYDDPGTPSLETINEMISVEYTENELLEELEIKKEQPETSDFSQAVSKDEKESLNMSTNNTPYCNTNIVCSDTNISCSNTNINYYDTDIEWSEHNIHSFYDTYTIRNFSEEFENNVSVVMHSETFSFLVELNKCMSISIETAMFNERTGLLMYLPSCNKYYFYDIEVFGSEMLAQALLSPDILALSYSPIPVMNMLNLGFKNYNIIQSLDALYWLLNNHSEPKILDIMATYCTSGYDGASDINMYALSHYFECYIHMYKLLKKGNLEPQYDQLINMFLILSSSLDLSSIFGRKRLGFEENGYLKYNFTFNWSNQVYKKGTIFRIAMPDLNLENGFTPDSLISKLCLCFNGLHHSSKTNAHLLSISSKALYIFYEGSFNQAMRFYDYITLRLQKCHFKATKKHMESQTYCVVYE